MKKTQGHTTKKNKMQVQNQSLPKSPTGIKGLDEITGGGLPKGRPTLVCGNAGCGKTLLAMEFLVRGAIQFKEPGVFIAFEETEKELTTNVASLGFNLEDIAAKKMMLIEHVHIERSEIEEAGEYDLEGLLIRINFAIDSIGAKRVVLDTIESLFGGLPNVLILRAELRRLFRFLKEKGVTVIITGERGDEMLTRQGLEEYVSDCVIVLDHRVTEQASTRRLRIVKYRGSSHGTNEYPFLIDETGFSVLPITSVGLTHSVSTERISSGIPRLDTMLSGKGYYRGSSILASGTAGTGKSSIATHLTFAACKRGERVLYFALEESPSQIIRNMRSIGINQEQWVKNGLLRFHSNRPTFIGLESYLTMMHKAIIDFKPEVVIVDPISSFIVGTNEFEAKSMIMRLVDFLKMNSITGFFTALTGVGSDLEDIKINVSSLIDTWLLLRDIEIGGERNRGLYILKSRGMAHSNQIREFLLTDNGVELRDVYVGPDGVLTGSARTAKEAIENSEKLLRKQEIERKQLALERKRKALDFKIKELQDEFEAESLEALKAISIDTELSKNFLQLQRNQALSRKADTDQIQDSSK
jgi:circadian clock protein KaiC